MPEGRRLGDLVERLHRRLETVRASAEELTLSELLEAKNRKSDGAPAQSEESDQQDDQSTVRVDAPDDRKSNVAVGGHPKEPSERAPRVHEETGKTLPADKSPATDAWHEEDLSQLSRAIIEVLQSAYPRKLSAPEIVDRLEGKGLQGGEVDKSAVNSKLYGRLHEWLVQKGETPPYWSLKSPNEVIVPGRETGEERGDGDEPRCCGCGEPLGDDRYVGESGMVCGVCAAAERGFRGARTDWQNETLSPVDQAILKALDRAYPGGLSTPNLTRRLQDRKDLSGELQVSGVYERLAGPLRPWVQRAGSDPVYWALTQTPQNPSE